MRSAPPASFFRNLSLLSAMRSSRHPSHALPKAVLRYRCNRTRNWRCAGGFRRARQCLNAYATQGRSRFRVWSTTFLTSFTSSST